MPGYEVIGEEEQAQLLDIFKHGSVLFRHGFDNRRSGCYKVRTFEKEFAMVMNIPYALAVSSGTAALRVALAALNLQPGDEVITQCFTFVATVEAIIESRATPVCTEIDDTFNMDPIDLERRITSRTKAVIVVHMLGTPARLVEIKRICDRHGLSLIEDTAWGCGGTLQRKSLGTWGRMGTYSFDFAKTMTTGEGGMVVFQQQEDYERAAAWHDHGHENNPAVPRWEDTRKSSGFNCRMSELQGAVGLAQLKKLPDIVASQCKNREKLWCAIKNIPGITPRVVPTGSEETADALVFSVADSQKAMDCRKNLLAKNISTKILPEATTWHFAAAWTHMPELVDSYQGKLEDAFPQSKSLLDRSVSLPVSVFEDTYQIEEVYDAIQGALR